MKVYVLTVDYDNDEGPQVEGVFTTRAAADQRAREIEAKQEEEEGQQVYCEIGEWEV